MAFKPLFSFWRNMKILNEEEQKNYLEKKKLLEDMERLLVNSYGRISYVSSDIHNIFSIKEKLSSNFALEILPLLQKFSVNVISIYNFRNLNNIELSEEEALEFITFYINTLKIYSSGVTSWYYNSIISTIQTFAKKGGIDSTKLLTLLLKLEFFKQSFVDSDAVKPFLDNVITNGKIEDSEKFISYIKEQIPEYKGFPLIIMNHNIDREEKIKALKMVYVQKDFPQYKRFFSKELNDLNDLDDFIEATVIQNNRVREKNNNIAQIFKDIFVNGESYDSGISKKEHLKEFSKKYISYFKDPSFVRHFYSIAVNLSTNSYRRENQYEDLLKNIFKEESAEEVIKILKEIPKLEPLGKNLPTLYNEAKEKNDIKTLKLIREVYWAWSNNNLDSFVSYLGKQNFNSFIMETSEDETRDKVLGIYKILDYNTRNGIVRNFETAVIELLPLENLKKAKIIDDLMYLNFPEEKIEKFLKESGSFYGFSTTILTKLRSLYSLNFIKIADKGAAEKEFIINRFFKPFENEETVMELTSNLMKINAAPEYVRKLSRWDTDKKENLVLYGFLALIDIILESFEKLYTGEEYSERLETVKNNFSNLKDTIDLVCSVEENY